MTDEELHRQFADLEDRLNARFDDLREYLMDFRSEAIRRIQQLEQRLDFQGTALASIRTEMGGLVKQALDSGVTSSTFIAEIADLRERIRKLEGAA